MKILAHIGNHKGDWFLAGLGAVDPEPPTPPTQFELAVQRLPGITNPMLTPAIKADWAARLTEHFYLVP